VAIPAGIRFVFGLPSAINKISKSPPPCSIKTSEVLIPHKPVLWNRNVQTRLVDFSRILTFFCLRSHFNRNQTQGKANPRRRIERTVNCRQNGTLLTLQLRKLVENEPFKDFWLQRPPSEGWRPMWARAWLRKPYRAKLRSLN
jgi:hypothetical protein